MTSLKGSLRGEGHIEVSDFDLGQTLKRRFTRDLMPGCQLDERQLVFYSEKDFNHGRESIRTDVRRMTDNEQIVWKWICELETSEQQKRLAAEKRKQKEYEDKCQIERQAAATVAEKELFEQLKMKYEGDKK